MSSVYQTRTFLQAYVEFGRHQTSMFDSVVWSHVETRFGETSILIETEDAVVASQGKILFRNSLYTLWLGSKIFSQLFVRCLPILEINRRLNAHAVHKDLRYTFDSIRSPLAPAQP